MAETRPKLYVQPASHPCAAVEAALALKSIEYDRVDVLPASQLMRLPAAFSFAEGAGFYVAGLTAYHALVQRGALRPKIALRSRGSSPRSTP